MQKPKRTALRALLALVAAFALAAVPPAAEGSRGLLYKVSGPQGQAYILGSIHVGDAAMYPFHSEIQHAMEASDTFVYECDTTSAEAKAALRARMALPEGLTLADAIGDDLYAQVSAVCDHLGLPIAALDGLRPWAVINTLAVYTTAAELGADSANQALSLGVEEQVRAKAAPLHKTVAYLETPQEQVDVLEGFSDALQRYLLESECQVILHPESVHGMDSTIALWPAWWRAGDAQAFADQYLQSYLEPGFEAEGAEYHQALITQRNARMAERLYAMLEKGGTFFVTVGLMHLVLPEDSLLTQLQARGCTVEAVYEP